jgi:lipoprotein-anchoring transpeptidase ErfK/SrfK
MALVVQGPVEVADVGEPMDFIARINEQADDPVQRLEQKAPKVHTRRLSVANYQPFKRHSEDQHGAGIR